MTRVKFAIASVIWMVGTSAGMSVAEYLATRPEGPVTVSGLASCASEKLCYIFGTDLDVHTTFSPEQLPVEDQYRLQRCDASLRECKIMLSGISYRTHALASIIAQSIQWER